MTLLIMLIASYLAVALRAFQSLNVVHDKKLLVVPTSFLLAVCEFSTISLVLTTQSWLLVIPLGFGGALGCVTSMHLHKKFRTK
jgi:hypothetical protein